MGGSRVFISIWRGNLKNLIKTDMACPIGNISRPALMHGSVFGSKLI